MSNTRTIPIPRTIDDVDPLHYQWHVANDLMIRPEVVAFETADAEWRRLMDRPGWPTQAEMRAVSVKRLDARRALDLAVLAQVAGAMIDAMNDGRDY